MTAKAITPDWQSAENRLKELQNNYLHGGSIGISLYMARIEPLARRFNLKKERSLNLYRLIVRAEDYQR